MNPTRRLTLSIAVLAVAAALLAAIARASGPRADATARVERLIAPEDAAKWSVAALTVTRRGERPLVYGRSAGRWRLLSHGGALAEDGAVESIIQSILDAQVSPRGATARAEQYGLVGEPALTVQLHGPRIGTRPDRDVLFTLETGAHLPGRGVTFARRAGRDEVLAVQIDLHGRLGESSAVPPLLETLLVPSDFLPPGAGIVEIVVERADGQGLTAELEPPMVAGGEPTWRMIPQGRRAPRATEPGIAAFYARFLLRAPFDALLDPAGLDPALLRAPEARILLHGSAGGEPIELVLLPPLADGRRVVLQSRDRLALGVEPALAEVLAAQPEHLSDIKTTPPWDRWFRLTLPPELTGGR